MLSVMNSHFLTRRRFLAASAVSAASVACDSGSQFIVSSTGTAMPMIGPGSVSVPGVTRAWRMLLDRLQSLVDAGRQDPEPGALIFIDLDNFKSLNDTYGHEMGDLLLREAAHRLTAAVRRNDIVARLGGDEFVVVLKGQRETTETFRRHAEIVSEKILAVMDEPYLLRGVEHHSTASLGICIFDTGTDTVTEMLQQADLAMYQAKAAGRNTIKFFEADMQLQASRRTELETRLRNALKQQEFRLSFQPQVTDQGKLLGFEVLLRWHHPERGLVDRKSVV